MKKNNITNLLILLVLSGFTHADNLEIWVENIHPIQGDLRIAIDNNEKSYQSNNTKDDGVFSTIIKVSKAKMRFVAPDLEMGEYAISVVHDKNSNQKLDFNLFGVPTEGYGFSNNVVGLFSKPSFDETKIDVGRGNQSITINLNY